MDEFKIISRSALYESEDEGVSSEEEQQIYAPDLEFVEVNFESSVPNENSATDAVADEEAEDEFAFPLFAGAGTSEDNVMKVSLKEEEEEIIINERPENYYRAIYSKDQHREFEISAVTYQDIWVEVNAPSIDSQPWKVMNLLEYNKKIELEKTHKKNKREGKRKRQNKSICRERRKEREKEIKRLEREAKKQRFRQSGQGWKSTKPRPKPAKSSQAVGKPKYRTE